MVQCRSESVSPHLLANPREGVTSHGLWLPLSIFWESMIPANILLERKFASSRLTVLSRDGLLRKR